MTVQLQTYLQEAVENRIVPMLKEVSSVFGMGEMRVVPYYTLTTGTPAWMIYNLPPSRGAFQSRAVRGEIQQTHTLALRLNLAPVEGGFSGNNSKFLGWTIIPTVMEYFAARPSLIYEDGQEKPRWLNPALTDIALGSPFGMFPEDANVIGVEFQLTLVFEKPVNTVYGNA